MPRESLLLQLIGIPWYYSTFYDKTLQARLAFYLTLPADVSVNVFTETSDVVQHTYLYTSLDILWFLEDVIGNLCILHYVSVHVYYLSRLLKTIHSKKYGVDQICFTHHTSSVVYSSKNGWDGKDIISSLIFITWMLIVITTINFRDRSLR